MKAVGPAIPRRRSKTRACRAGLSGHQARPERTGTLAARFHELQRLKLQACLGCPCLSYRPGNAFPAAPDPGELVVQRLAVPMLIRDRTKPSILVAMDIFSRHVFHCCLPETVQCRDVARFLNHVGQSLKQGIKAVFLSEDIVRNRTALSFGAWTVLDGCGEDFNALENFLGRAGAAVNAHAPWSQADLAERLDRYVQIYNRHIRQRGLGYRTPAQVIGLAEPATVRNRAGKRRDTRSRIVKRLEAARRHSPAGASTDT